MLGPILVALLATSALAVPVPSTNHLAKRHFTVPIKTHTDAIRDGHHEMVKAARKYGGGGWEIIISNPSGQSEDGAPSSTVESTPTSTTTKHSTNDDNSSPNGSSQPAPSSSASGTTSAQEGEVSATPEQNDSEYLAPVTIGGQTLTLDFDTGSSDLWVFSTSLSPSAIGSHTAFDPSKSSTWTPYKGASWTISYGDGSGAGGTVGYDQVSIGGTTVAKQAVELANQIDASFEKDVANDGLLGLGFSSINTVQPRAQKTFFDNVKSSLDAPLFTADLRDSAGGSYEFGRIDSDKYSGDIHYTSIDKSNGFWQFQSPTFTIGSNGQSQRCRTCSPAIADTGTSLLLLDQDIVQEYYSSVPSARYDQNQGGYIFPCNTQLPDLSVAIGTEGYEATVPGQLFVYAPVDSARKTCFGGLQPSGAGVQILGDVLFKHFFAVFDGTDGKERFGVAEKK